MESFVCAWFVCVCVCERERETVNTTLWFLKESRKIFTHSTHLLDVLQAEVAPANKWICVSDTRVILLLTIGRIFIIFHYNIRTQSPSPELRWIHFPFKQYIVH